MNLSTLLSVESVYSGNTYTISYDIALSDQGSGVVVLQPNAERRNK